MTNAKQRLKESIRLMEETPQLKADELPALKILAGEDCPAPAQRPAGQVIGAFAVPDSFFEPLPDGLRRRFNGEGPGPGDER